MPIGGQALLYRKPEMCATPNTANCLDQTAVPGFVLCKCYDLAIISSRSPTLGTRTLPAPADPPIGLGPSTSPPPLNPNGPSIPDIPTEPSSPKDGDSSGGLIKVPSPAPIVPTSPRFTTFAISTAVLQMIILAIYILLICFKATLNRIAKQYFEKCSTVVLIHDIVQQIEKLDDLDKMFNPEKEEAISEDSTSSSDCSIKEAALHGKQKLALKRLIELKKKHPELDLSSLRETDLRKLSILRFFFMYFKLNHAWTSLAFLRSSRYYRVTMITLVYTRIITHLAVSMFFTLSRFR
jgi:hypothetical protein